MISNEDITVQDLFVHVENWLFLRDINSDVLILKSFVSNKFTEEQLEECYPEGWLIYFKWNHLLMNKFFLTCCCIILVFPSLIFLSLYTFTGFKSLYFFSNVNFCLIILPKNNSFKRSKLLYLCNSNAFQCNLNLYLFAISLSF